MSVVELDTTVKQRLRKLSQILLVQIQMLFFAY